MRAKTLIISFCLCILCIYVSAQHVDTLNMSNTQIDITLKGLDGLALKQPDSVRKIAERMLVISKKNHYRSGIGKSFNLIGLTYWVRSMLPVSQFYLVLAVPYLKGNSAALSDCYRNIARNYVDLKDYDKASHYFMGSLKLAGKDVNMRATIFTDMTAIFNATNDTTNGIVHLKLAFRYVNKSGKEKLKGILYNRTAQILIAQNKLDAAYQMLDSVDVYARKFKNDRLLSVSVIDKGRVLLLKGQFNDAKLAAEKGFELARLLGSYNLQLRALKVLADVYKQNGNLQMNANIHEQQLEIYESSRNFSNNKTLQMIQDYDKLNGKLDSVGKMEINSKANIAMIKTQHRTIALLVTFLLVAIVFLFVIIVYYRQKNQLNHKLVLQRNELTMQKRLIEEQRSDLEVVNKLKDKLLGIIGHDLRTPIANLSSIIDLFANKYVTTDEIKKLMLDISPVVKGAELTLSNLMDFALGQIKGQTVTPSNVNLFLIAVEMRMIFEHQLSHKNITLNNNFEADTTAWADANHVKVIIRNLLSNAIKFTSVNGEVNISATTKENTLTVCVRDNGVGMDANELNQLFKSNSHFSHQGTSGEKGTGLGLLLSKELVEMNKGTIWAESQPGQGSKFCFTLPLLSN